MRRTPEGPELVARMGGWKKKDAKTARTLAATPKREKGLLEGCCGHRGKNEGGAGGNIKTPRVLPLRWRGAQVQTAPAAAKLGEPQIVGVQVTKHLGRMGKEQGRGGLHGADSIRTPVKR